MSVVSRSLPKCRVSGLLRLPTQEAVVSWVLTATSAPTAGPADAAASGALYLGMPALLASSTAPVTVVFAGCYARSEQE